MQSPDSSPLGLSHCNPTRASWVQHFWQCNHFLQGLQEWACAPEFSSIPEPQIVSQRCWFVQFAAVTLPRWSTSNAVCVEVTWRGICVLSLAMEGKGRSKPGIWFSCCFPPSFPLVPSSTWGRGGTAQQCVSSACCEASANADMDMCGYIFCIYIFYLYVLYIYPYMDMDIYTYIHTKILQKQYLHIRKAFKHFLSAQIPAPCAGSTKDHSWNQVPTWDLTSRRTQWQFV